MSETFYVTGGTIPPDSPSYIERAADKELLAALGRGELCYVLNARQMGKSSLSVRTRQALEAAGTRTAFLDLQKFGSSASAEQWYRALLERIGSDLKLRAPFLTYWKENSELPPLSRLFGALRDVGLEQIAGNVVVFLDEIDVVRDLSFKTDEFFGAIRESYNARADDPALRRLTFCIIGTVAPTDLIRDIRLSPFNIGTRVRLADLTPTEAAPLAAPLPGGAKTLGRVLWWTSGHPYLTQRLCAELTRTASTHVDAINSGRIDAMVARLFFAKSDADVDENIKNVRNGLLRMGGEGTGFDRTDLLTRYGAIAAGKRVADDDTDGVCTALRLSGLVTSSEGTLRVRNRVYARLFGTSWVRANLPDAEVRRQRAAVARARWQVGSISVSVLVVMAGLLWQTTEAKTHARMEAALERAARLDADVSRNKAQGQSELARKATTRALTASALAEKALKGESAARASALANALAAQASAAKATTQADRADREASAAKQQTAAARHSLYISAIGMASQNIESRNFRVASQFLKDASGLPRSERGFEWNYLRERLHPELRLLNTGSGPTTAVNWFPDGKRVLTCNWDGTTAIWDDSARKPVALRKGLAGSVTSVATSPDGRRYVTGGNDTRAHVWDTASGKQLAVLRGHTKRVTSVCFSPDGNSVLTGSEDDTARLWNAEDGRELLKVRINAAEASNIYVEVSSVAFSPDGASFATTSWDTTPRIWNAKTGASLFVLHGHESNATSIAYSPDGKRIVSGSLDKTARVWDTLTGKELLKIAGHTEPVKSVAFSRDGQSIVTGSQDNTSRVWNATTGELQLALNGHGDEVGSVCFSPDGDRILTGSGDGTARIWDAKVSREALIFNEHNSNLNAVCFSPDGKRIATASADGTSRIVDSENGALIAVLQGHSGPVESVAFSANGKRIVTASWDRTARIWDAASGKQLVALKGHLDAVTSAAFSPDGNRVVTGSRDRTARVWDASTGKALFKLQGVTEIVNCVAWSPDGKSVAIACNDTGAHICDALTGAEARPGRRFSADVTALAFSPDSRSLLTGTSDLLAQLWDLPGGAQSNELKGHTQALWSVAFSPDGNRIVTSSWDNSVRVWDRATGRQLTTLTMEDGFPRGAVFSPDGNRIASGGMIGTVIIWRRPTAAQVNAAAQHNSHLSEAVLEASVLNSLSQSPIADVNAAARAMESTFPERKAAIANALNTIAWRIVDPDITRTRHGDFTAALGLVELAVKYSGGKDGAILDTLAAAQFACGDLNNALETERTAVRQSSPDKAIVAAMSANLKHYETLTAAQKASKK